MSTTTTAPSRVDEYRVKVCRYDAWPGIEHLVIDRHDQAPIESCADVCAVKDDHVPGGDVRAIDLWVMPPSDPAENGTAVPPEPPLPSPAAAAAAAARTPAATPTPVRRRVLAPRRSGTLNLARRETSVLDELVDITQAATGQIERFKRLINDGDKVQLLAGVKGKLERLPHDDVDGAGADW
jgi:hypothetical protein